MTILSPSRPMNSYYPWIPDQGDGSYCNPIIHADYSDPDVVRVGEDFYLTASSFQCTPGLPILHSRDLVNWTLIGHALKNLPHPRYAEVQHGQGVWAPAIRHYAGKFWIFFPTPDEGIYVTTADDPMGRWSEPHLVQAGRGLIDPCPLWDDDGRAYLVHAYAHSRTGIKHRLRVCPMAPDASRLLGEGQVVFDAPERHPVLEGPKFLRKDGWYYILAPAGGVADGWQVALRARDIYGPYEDKIVLEQGQTQPVNGPHQGALVELRGGEWWFVHFQDADVYGRITHLQPVEWREDWPLIGVDGDGNGIGEPVLDFHKPTVPGSVPVAVPQTSDRFTSGVLGPQWQWNANHRSSWYALDPQRGCLRLFAQPMPAGGLALTPNLLLQKFPARAFSVQTTLEFFPQAVGEQAGLTVMGLQYATLALRRSQSGLRVVLQVNGRDVASAPVASSLVRLRVDIQAGGLCAFSYAPDPATPWTPFGEAFQAVAGRWIGARVGLYSVAPTPSASVGFADFHGFQFA